MKRYLLLLLSVPLCLFPTSIQGQDIPLLPFGSVWKYLDNGSNQGTAWRASGFNDSGWASGPSELGYGDGDEATVLSFGPNTGAKYITTYFRRSLSIPDVNAFAGFLLRIKRDDAFVVYLNGNEVMRQNFNEGSISYTTLAYGAIADSEEPKILSQLLTPAQFSNGTNVLAVEMHQSAATSSDLSFNLELTGLDTEPSLFRGPYLQAASPTAIVIKWKTDVPTDSRVRYGTQPEALTDVVHSAAPTREHEMAITGLQPGTTYHYCIGSSTTDLACNDPSLYFRTAPPIGSPSPVRIWAIGDAGTAYASQGAVRDSYLNHIAGSQKADVWLMLGDNAYNHGRECEYQQGVFQNMYEQILWNTPLSPCIGNHDYYSGANGLTNTGTYYTLFAPPKLGEAGGVPSNTEAYYSFNHGNVHFIALDSYGVSRAVTGAMANWLVSDLAQAQANGNWIIAYWHHPPYTKGSHDSDNIGDSGGIMQDMRQNILPILESHGVDLVLSGHSHSYERSYLINGHYGLSGTFDAATMKLDGTPGSAVALGPYAKPGVITPNMGTVYAVCGVSGKKDASGSLNHPAMCLSTTAHWGSMIIDIAGNTLTAKFLNDQGTVVDRFDIRKQFPAVLIAPKVFLAGPFDPVNGLMHDSLRVRGMVPLQQPYSGLFTPMGEESQQPTTAGVLSTTGNNAVVDWVWVELRDVHEPARIVASKAALLQRDGDVVDHDGTSAVGFNVPAGSYLFAVHHRNHFGVMAAVPITLSSNVTDLDLSSPATSTHGTNAQQETNGVRLLWSGNVLKDRSLRYVGGSNDRDPILVRIGGMTPTAVASCYCPEDVNMDGSVLYTGLGNDRDPILLNVGGSLVTAERTEQLP